MKCPYHIKTRIHTQTYSDKNDNDSGLSSGYISDYYSEHLMDCLQEERGAYYDGKCNYKA